MVLELYIGDWDMNFPKLGGNSRMKAGWFSAEVKMILGLNTAFESGQNKVFIKIATVSS